MTARCSRLLTRPSCLSSRLGYGLRVRLCRSKPPHVRCFWFEGATEFVKASLERKPSAKLRRSFPLPGEPRQSPLSTRPSMASSSSGVLGLALQHEGRGFRWQSMAWSPEARACMFPNLSRNGRLPCFDIEVSPKSETEEGSREGAPPGIESPISFKLGTACRPITRMQHRQVLPVPVRNRPLYCRGLGIDFAAAHFDVKRTQFAPQWQLCCTTKNCLASPQP